MCCKLQQSGSLYSHQRATRGAAVIHDDADFARNAISVCPCIVRHLSDDRRGAGGSYNQSGRDCISLLLLSSPLSFLALFMILLVTVQGIGFRTHVHFYIFYNGDEVTSQFVSVCNVRKSVSMLFLLSHSLFNPFSLFLLFIFYPHLNSHWNNKNRLIYVAVWSQIYFASVLKRRLAL